MAAQPLVPTAHLTHAAGEDRVAHDATCRAHHAAVPANHQVPVQPATGVRWVSIPANKLLRHQMNAADRSMPGQIGRVIYNALHLVLLPSLKQHGHQPVACRAKGDTVLAWLHELVGTLKPCGGSCAGMHGRAPLGVQQVEAGEHGLRERVVRVPGRLERCQAVHHRQRRRRRRPLRRCLLAWGPAHVFLSLEWP